MIIVSDTKIMNRSGVLLQDTSRGYGCPQKYIQGPGELANIFAYGSKYGTRLLFLIDGGVFDMISGAIDAIADKCGCTYEVTSFSGECCMENVALLSDTVRKHNCSVLVGVGGGKVLDTAKLVGDQVDMPRIIVPTSASSDAPAADWAAVYTAQGVHISGRPTRRSTELVLVDSKIIVGAPARLFAAGIGDALATWFEAQACQSAYTPNCVGRGYRSSRAAMAVSRECHQILMADGLSALEAVKSHVVTEAVENVIEANILLSGLGFINGGLAGSHGFHNGFSNIPGSKKYLHGELVAFGLICQLMLENAPTDTVNSVVDFLYNADLPITLDQIGIECTADNLETIAEHTLNKNILIHHEPFAVSKDSLKGAIIAANNVGHRYFSRMAQRA